MGGRIPIDLGVNFQRNPAPTAVPAGFGVERFNKVAERGQVIANLGAKVSDIAADYAAKNKRADLRADAMAAQSQLKTIQTEAQMRASETDDPNEIRQIWQEAHGRYNSWINGKSDKGVPNIRWGEQQKEMVAHADVLQHDFVTSAEMRIAEVGKRNSNAKALQSQRDAEMAGDRETIMQAVQVRIENGTLTREEAEVEKRASFLKSDLIIAKNNTSKIDNMTDPAKAQELAAEFEKQVMLKDSKGRWLQYDTITAEADRGELVQKAKAAAERVKTRAEKAELDRFGSAQVAGEIDGRTPVEKIEKLFPNLSYEVKLKLRKAESEAKPVMTKELIAGAFSDIASTEVTPENGILLARRLDRQGFKKETDVAVWNAFNEKFNPNFSSSIGENQPFYAIEKAKLTDALVKANNGKWYKPKVYDYGEGDSGNPDKDKLSAFNAVLARETVLMDSFVKERLKKGTPYNQAVGEYWEQPRIKKMVDDLDIAALIDKTLVGKTSKDNEKSIDSGFSTLTNRTATVQSSLYVSDDDFNEITGLKF